MKHEAQVSGTPALKSNDGEWLLDAQGKANFFPVTFAENVQASTSVLQCHELQTSVVCPSAEQCMAVLTSLCDDSSTGPVFFACSHPQTLRGTAGQTSSVPGTTHVRDQVLA